MDMDGFSSDENIVILQQLAETTVAEREMQLSYLAKEKQKRLAKEEQERIALENDFA